MKKHILTIITALVVIICTSTIVMANISSEEPANEDIIINAEDIGIKTIDKVEEQDVIVEDENTNMDDSSDIEEVVQKEEIYHNEEKVEIEDDILDEDSQEELFEGYEEGTYFEPNHFGDCELHEYCYICPECIIEEEIGYDEEINPNGGYYLSKTCIICGHGTCEPVDEGYYIE